MTDELHQSLIAEVRRLRAIVDACARAGCPTAGDGKQARVFVTRFSNYEPAEIGEIYATREGAELAAAKAAADVGHGWGWHVEEWPVREDETKRQQSPRE